MPENRPSDENPPVLKKKEGVFDARHYQEYAAREEAKEAEEKGGKSGEFKAVHPEGPLRVPPKEYRDPSEFKDAKKRTTLEAIQEGAAVEKAMETGPAAEWAQERKANEQEQKRWAETFIGLSPRAITQKLEQQLDMGGASREKAFLSDVSEVLYNIRKLKTRDNPLVKDVIAGMETFLKDQTVMVSPEAKATQKKLRAEEQAGYEAQKRESYAREMPAVVNPNAETQPDMAAITPQEQDWFDKGDRGEVEDDDNPGGGMVGRLAGRH